MHTRYMKHKYTFPHEVFFQTNSFHPFLADGLCFELQKMPFAKKKKKWDALGKAEVLLL